MVYEQKLLETVAAREGKASQLKVNVRLRTNETVVGANITSRAEDNSIAPHRITLICQQTRTRDLIDDTYDAVICGTGYERTAWIRLLRTSNMAKEFGLEHATDDTPVRLVPEHYPVPRHVDDEPAHFPGPEHSEHHSERDHSNGVESVSSPSTPLSSPSLFTSPALPAPIQVRISRAYRLLPAQSGENSQSRVYLQGCAEATHGLSDTLLSVIGIRAGEVVDDLDTRGN